ncbi:MAG TPA: UpxY family transcription antiterminator [Bacteroidales bacterium]|nr:UpxY family transcription antiterminator [Bacteroidales bacterium]
MNNNKLENNWYVFYCKSRAEKKAYDELVKQEFNVYLPLVQTERIWSDRIKKVQLPMFSGYIFVKCNKFAVSKVLQLSQIVAPVKTGAEYSKARERDIELLRIVEQHGLYYSSETSGVKKGDKVEIVAGPLKGYNGYCIEESGQRLVVIAIEGVNQDLKIKISKGAARKIKES